MRVLGVSESAAPPRNKTSQVVRLFPPTDLDVIHPRHFNSNRYLRVKCEKRAGLIKDDDQSIATAILQRSRFQRAHRLRKQSIATALCPAAGREKACLLLQRERPSPETRVVGQPSPRASIQ